MRGFIHLSSIIVLIIRGYILALRDSLFHSKPFKFGNLSDKLAIMLMFHFSMDEGVSLHHRLFAGIYQNDTREFHFLFPTYNRITTLI